MQLWRDFQLQKFFELYVSYTQTIDYWGVLHYNMSVTFIFEVIEVRCENKGRIDSRMSGCYNCTTDRQQVETIDYTEFTYASLAL